VTFSGVAWTRFGSLVLLDAGITPSQAGVLKSLGHFSKLLAQPFWGFLADKTSAAQALLLSLLFASVSLEVVHQGTVAKTWPFGVYLAVRMVRSACNAVGPLTDAIVVNTIRGSSEGYGRQRMFSSMAWGLGAVISGWMIDRFGLQVVFPFCYVLCAIAIAIVVAISYIESALAFPEKTREASHQTSRPSIWQMAQMLLQILKLKGMALFASQVVIMGFTMVLADSILPLQIDQQFHAPRAFNGFTTMVSVLSGIPIFWHADRLIRDRGPIWVMRAAQLTTAARFCAIAAVMHISSSHPADTEHLVDLGDERQLPPFLWIIVVLQLLHGVSFAGSWCVATHVIQRVSPRAVSASAQVLVTQLYFTVGQGCGNVFWHRWYEADGLAGRIYLAGALALIASAYGAFVLGLQSVEATILRQAGSHAVEMA